MATFDLEEQEQLDNLKAFWAKWGNLITTLVTLALLAFAGVNGWNWWQREQGLKGSVLYDEIERAHEAKDADKALRLWQQMQDKLPRTTYAGHGALLTAQSLQEAGKSDAAIPVLEWAIQKAQPDALGELAALRLAGLHLEAKRFEPALAALDKVKSDAFAALAADKRGDVAQLQGKLDEARSQYSKAFQGLAEDQGYRRLVEAKLMALAVDPSTLQKSEKR
ncbi:YfgM family protein [Inhella gelatinilytica]|uniref:Ancillary SecYEG translocon subunit n=1 Tax=Inhella gelatinilytica TaxID=2795030 RepID=A0A931IZL2_9BURK|nr:tetratricopeptide repeat protein [Inhella gelatinilytica]MBH9553483.1 tetratricopeptide repeat protein [Inhella gelatinilytica]